MTINKLINGLKRLPGDTKLEDMDLIVKIINGCNLQQKRKIKNIDFICNIHKRSTTVSFPQLVINVEEYLDVETRIFMEKMDRIGVAPYRKED